MHAIENILAVLEKHVKQILCDASRYMGAMPSARALHDDDPAVDLAEGTEARSV